MSETRTIIGRPKPVHGFASLTEAVIVLRSRDVPFGEISRLTGSPESSLRTLASRARPHGKARLSIPGDVTRALQPFAEARGLTVSELAAEILRAALAAGVDRMLDDGGAE